MFKRFFSALVTVLAAVAIGAGLAVVPRMDALAAPAPVLREADPEPVSSSAPAAAPREESEPPAEAVGASAAEPEETGYLLGEWGGRVSVLSPGTREPEMIFDIFLRTLPEPDQELLRQGIRVETYEELTRLIEDYIS